MGIGVGEATTVGLDVAEAAAFVGVGGAVVGAMVGVAAERVADGTGGRVVEVGVTGGGAVAVGGTAVGGGTVGGGIVDVDGTTLGTVVGRAVDVTDGTMPVGEGTTCVDVGAGGVTVTA